MKRIVSILVVLAIVLTAAFALAEDGITIGIGQFAVHGSLDNCRKNAAFFARGAKKSAVFEKKVLTNRFHRAIMLTNQNRLREG